jgi:hypothetical protein
MRWALPKGCSKAAMFSTSRPPDGLQVILIGTGSELDIAYTATHSWLLKALASAVVSLPSWELFQAQPASYQAAVLPAGVAKVAVEAASPFGWERWVGNDPERSAVVGIDRFGASAPYQRLYSEFGITADQVAAAARRVMARRACLHRCEPCSAAPGSTMRIEHATLTLLAERYPGRRLAGYSDPAGFSSLTDLPQPAVRRALTDALARLRAGEARLAVHPFCGTNTAGHSAAGHDAADYRWPPCSTVRRAGRRSAQPLRGNRACAAARSAARPNGQGCGCSATRPWPPSRTAAARSCVRWPGEG